jgi:hypothetical protein
MTRYPTVAEPSKGHFPFIMKNTAPNKQEAHRIPTIVFLLPGGKLGRVIHVNFKKYSN